MTYRYFSYAAGICFVAHVLVQILLNKISGIPYGKKSAIFEGQTKPNETLEINSVENKNTNDDGDEFKDVDLTK